MTIGREAVCPAGVTRVAGHLSWRIGGRRAWAPSPKQFDTERFLNGGRGLYEFFPVRAEGFGACLGMAFALYERRSWLEQVLKARQRFAGPTGLSRARGVRRNITVGALRKGMPLMVQEKKKRARLEGPRMARRILVGNSSAQTFGPDEGQRPFSADP